jgi:cell division transport system permease protein
MKSNQASSSVKQLRHSEPLKRRSLMMGRIVKYGISNFARNGWLSVAAIVVMTFTLLTVFVAGAATVTLNDTVESTKIDKLDLPLYLRPDTPVDIQDELKQLLEAETNVAYVTINTKDDNLAKLEANVEIDEETRSLIEESGEKLEDILPVYMGIHVRDIADIDSLIAIVNGEDSAYRAFLDVNSYETQFFNGESQKTVQNMANLANMVQMIGFILGGVFLFITILVIFNTIRLAIFARRDEIEMEKLIGAEKSYVRGPFLVEAEIYGIISGVIALGAGYGLIIAFIPAVLTGEAIGGVSTAMLHTVLIGWAPAAAIGMVLIGIIIGNLSARLAVRKYLRY